MLRHGAAIERDIGTQGHPRRRRRYAGDDADNRRWEGFGFRPVTS
jgi:hypothetical protein